MLQCVQNMMNEFLPRMHKGNAAEFRSALKGDGEAQSVIGSYSEKIDAWIKKLQEKAEKSNSDVYTQFVAYLEEKGCLGTRSIETTEASGLQVTHKSSLTELQRATRIPRHTGPRAARRRQAVSARRQPTHPPKTSPLRAEASSKVPLHRAPPRTLFPLTHVCSLLSCRLPVASLWSAAGCAPVCCRLSMRPLLCSWGLLRLPSTRAYSSYDLTCMMEALARCGDAKHNSIVQMSFASRVRSMVQNVLGQATEMEVITEVVASEASEGAADFDEKVKEAQRKNWLICWKNMTFKDLHGFLLWETQLHDVLQAAFPELQSIFLHYCGSSVQGSESIGNATKVGLMEFLTIAKDTDLCTKEFKIDELTRHFSSANAEAAIANSGSADRHKLKSARSPGDKKDKPSAKATTSRQAKKEATADMQLNLFEFINCLVRVAFWRCNPQWGSKYNKKDLTPVPESTQILLEECILPKAKRDTSGEFKKVLASDQATQAVLAEYREKLQNWLRPILRKERTIQNPNPQMTYKMWVALMDGPDPESREVGAKKPPCPKMVGEWFLAQESQITGDERTSRKNQITFKAKLSIPQCRWNFLRSQTIEQVEGGDVDEEKSASATLDFAELGECISRCAVNMYEHLMKTFLPSHDRKAMTMADATKAFLENLLWEKTPEMAMWEATVIKANRYDFERETKVLPGFSPAQHKLWCACWPNIPLMDVHHFPLWEKGVHDTLQQHFPTLMRIFSHYSKGISGIDSAADALEMELEEFHDFVKDAKMETRMINFTTMTVVFAKANATNTAEAFEQRKKEKRNSTVVGAQEEEAAKKARGCRSRPRREPSPRWATESTWAPRLPSSTRARSRTTD